jgi:hypothetical protein
MNFRRARDGEGLSVGEARGVEGGGGGKKDGIGNCWGSAGAKTNATTREARIFYLCSWIFHF